MLLFRFKMNEISKILFHEFTVNVVGHLCLPSLITTILPLFSLFCQRCCSSLQNQPYRAPSLLETLEMTMMGAETERDAPMTEAAAPEAAPCDSTKQPPSSSSSSSASSLGPLPQKAAPQEQQQQQQQDTITLIAKFGKERIHLTGLSPDMTIGQVKGELQQHTHILPKRQKLLGLTAQTGGAKGVHDQLPLSQLKLKNNNATAKQQHQFILMGTPEEAIFVDPHQLSSDDLPEVVDDFELDFNAGSDLWLRHVSNGENLQKFTAQTAVHLMHPPRPNKPLLVLDLDHTLLDFSSRAFLRNNHPDGAMGVVGHGVAAAMKRPHMDHFLQECYQHYDLVVWSQTSWRWLETKLTELGMLTHAGYRFCFVLDKTSMFTVVSTKRDGSSVTHHVKPLQIIWSKFADRWGSHNTVHLDDLSRNFALNLDSGLKCTAYHRKKNRRDNELLGLARYLVQLAQAKVDFQKVNFANWLDVLQGNAPLVAMSSSEDGDEDQKEPSSH